MKKILEIEIFWGHEVLKDCIKSCQKVKILKMLGTKIPIFQRGIKNFGTKVS